MSAKAEAIRGGAAVLAIGIVVALLIGDRGAGDHALRSVEPDPTISTPSDQPAPDPEAPIPTDALPTPPPDLEDLVCQHPPRPTPLRVLSFNTHRASGTLAYVVQEVRAVKADVVLLQEVDRHLERSGRVDQPEAYADALGMDGSFSANLRMNGGEYGTLVLSKHPIVQEGRVPLPDAPRAEPRGLQWVTLDVGGRLVRVYNTHLQSVGPELRQQQAQVVASVLAREDFPAVVGGDFNAPPRSDPITTLTDVLTDSWVVGTGSEVTGLTRKIDYIFVNDHITPLRSQVARSGVSDHHRLWADIEVGPGRQCSARGQHPLGGDEAGRHRG